MLGNKVIRAIQTTRQRKKGTAALAMVLLSLPVMFCSTNKLKPTGGVTSAISTSSTMKMPNQIRSKPAGFDLIWFGIFIVLLVEIAEVTPPVGFNLFVLQNMTGKDSNTIAKAAVPFFLCLVVCIALITLFPSIVTYLPDAVMGVDK